MITHSKDNPIIGCRRRAGILTFQADREIVWIITAKKRYMATHPLREIDERLRGTIWPNPEAFEYALRMSTLRRFGATTETCGRCSLLNLRHSIP